MSLPERYLVDPIRDALAKKMVFLGGPRQAGKTTLALHLLNKKRADEDHPAYLNWDRSSDAKLFRNQELPFGEPLIVLDEIHKYAKWRNTLKGIYDTHKSKNHFLITGSARLDYYRKGGDSLVGRYRYFRLHPFSLLELNKKPSASDLKSLLQFGGFPEPLFDQKENEHRIWQRDRIAQIIREDLRDLEKVKEVSLVELLVDALPGKVGSPLSVKSLKEDLQVDHKTVERWITILENLFVCFRIAPYGAPKIRAVKKEQKLYLWDWSQVENPGARFENLVASQLLKYAHHKEDTEGYRMEVRYLRDTDGREVDFIVLKDKKPQFAVEVKLSQETVDQSTYYFKERIPGVPFFHVHTGKLDSIKNGVRSLPFAKLCQELQLP